VNYRGNIRARFARAMAYDSNSYSHNCQAPGKTPIANRAGFLCSPSCETLLRPDIGK